MKDIKTETVKLLASASQNIVQMVASSSFEFWKRKDFRLYVDFDNLNQTEQDRMFNELEVSALGLLILKFENAAEAASGDEKRKVFSALKKDLGNAFLQLLIDAGVEAKFISQWKILIDCRMEEYRKDFKTAQVESSKMKEFKKGEDGLRTAWARIETITIDCLTHLRRGNMEEKDLLWKLLRKWFINIETQLAPITQSNLS